MNLLGSTLTISSLTIVSKERLLYQIELAFSNDMNSISHKKTYYKEKKTWIIYMREIFIYGFYPNYMKFTLTRLEF